MMPWLERIACVLIRLHGREFSASYREAILETMQRRGERARADGQTAFAIFALREIASLMTSSIGRWLPRWQFASASGGVAAPTIERTGRELARAARRLIRVPLFSTGAMLTLTIAIASTVTMAVMLWRIVLAPLPYPAAGRLIALDHAAPGLGINSGVGMSIGLYREYAKLPSIDAIALYAIREGTISGDGQAARARFIQATPEIGTIAGLVPQLGRWFAPLEAEAGGPGVVVLTNAMWRARFGSDAGVIGKTVRIDGTPYEIVGVLPPRAGFVDPRVQFFMPLPLPRAWTRATGFNYAGVARLSDGTSIEQAHRDQDAVIASLRERFPADGEISAMLVGGLRPRATPLKDALVGDVSATLWALMSAAAMIWLLACANLANLFLVRHESRIREQAVQRALGAGFWDIASGIVSETVVIAVGSGVFAGSLAQATISLAIAYAPPGLPRIEELRSGALAIALTAVVSAAAALACAWLPLIRLGTRRPATLLSLERSAISTLATLRTRHALMALQVALAVGLLCVSGLMTRSFQNLLRVDPGFDAASRLVFDVNLPRSEYRTRSEAAQLHSLLLDRLSGIAGIDSVSATSTLPLEGLGLGDPLEVRGSEPRRADALPVVRFRRVSHDYFAAIGIPLEAGRMFDLADREGLTDAVIIDSALARQYFGAADPIGREVRPFDGDSPDRWLTIIGIVGNTVTEGLAEAAIVPKMYVPLRGSMWADVPSPHDMTYVARVSGDPAAPVSAVRSTLAGINPRIALARPEALEQVLARARATRAMTTLILLVSAIVAALIGVVGIYSVVTYAVHERRAEIGVRVALGATPPQVVGMIVRHSMAIITAGIAAGVALAIAGTTILRALLFGVGPGDWLAHLVVALGTFAVAAAACWWPASRAARIDPRRALGGTL